MPTRLVYLPARHQLDYLAEHVRHLLADRQQDVLLVTANQSGRRLWDTLAALGVATDHLRIVDVVSSPLLAHSTADSTHIMYLGNPMAIEALISRCDRLARTKMAAPLHVVVHNLNAFCLYNSSEVLEEAIRRVARDVADPDLLIDYMVEEGPGMYRDLERFLQHFVDFRKDLGPRMMVTGDRKSSAEHSQR